MSAFWSSFPRVRDGLDRVKERLLAQADSLPADLRDELSPLVRRQGKSLRAGLILLASGVVEGERLEAVESAAAAVELLHLATLVHDDIVDQAALRRGEPALHQRLGPQKAVLYGDLLFAAAFRSVSRDVGPASARSLADLVTVMAGAEIQQWNDRFRLPVSPRRILRKTMGKTALLFSLSLYVGAREGGRPEAVAVALRRAGYALGMAFQLQDDLLDWTGDPATLGKPILEDLTAGIYTWPVAEAWTRDAGLTRRELDDVREGRLAPGALRDRWADRGLWAGSERLVERYVARAEGDLDRALGPSGPERRDWDRFLALLIKRRA
jgi:heptaprenyl diphosphate synthase